MELWSPRSSHQQPILHDALIPTGCSKRLSSKAAASKEARRTLRYVEPLSDARTLLADFFSILLGDAALAPTGVYERSQKPKRRVGQRGCEELVFLISLCRQLFISLLGSTYPFQAL